MTRLAMIFTPLTTKLELAMLIKKQRNEKIKNIKRFLKKENAVLVAHYYTSEELQMVAEETGGYI